jgi:hypothetical protein
MRWAIKRSFIDYIARSPGGKCSLSGGAVASELKEVVFAPDLCSGPTVAPGGTAYAFRGSVVFTAHFGVLFVKIANPCVTIQDGRGELTVVDPFQSEGDARLRLVEFDIVDHLIAEGFEHWAADNVRLTPEGCPLFNDVYPVSELFEPFVIIVPEASAPTKAIGG